MLDCIFCKIANGEVPKEFIYEDREVMVFPDINPRHSVHLLIMPKKHLPEFIKVDESSLWKKLCGVVQKMIKKQKLEDRGYRIVINGGGAQIIDHFHIHLLGPMGKTVKL